ncbi:MAG: hypothetical protein HN922_07035 [Anaerolineae bacterium]|jgi:hypothetical protein|nr:hypothetical protein [Anaerolineae bacterium]MBT7782655.1 hypothetical protein [Anaerolineae bacterium]
MSSKIRFNLLLLIIVVLCLQPLGSIRSAYAENTIQFSEESVKNNFPDELVFRVKVSSSAGEIVGAKFVSTNDSYYSSRSYSRKIIEIEASNEVFLEYIFDTRDSTTPPMMPYTYFWEVEDEDGNRYESEPITIRYDDTRYDWQTLENDDIGVWWHDRPASFGETIFDIAKKAVKLQNKLFQTDLDYKMRIVIYNSSDEFAAWHSLAHDWVGGETYGNYGITAQIVEDTSYQKSWLNNVIPHEISHLYFAQITHNPTVSVPVWLNEGVAQYNEFIDHEWEFGKVRDAAKKGDIIPLSSLANGFGAFNEERVYLAYYESVSAVSYFVETYGSENLSALLSAYKEGQLTDEAFKSAIGIGVGEFEAAWAVSVGVTEGYATNTPWPLPTFIPSPTMMVFGAATSVPVVKTPEPTLENTAIATPVIAETEVKTKSTTRSLPCLSTLGVIFSMGGVFFLKLRFNL